MGRARRWLKGLFGTSTTKEKHEKMEYSVQSRDKRQWSSGPLAENGALIPPNITPAEVAWLRSFYAEPDDEQKRHARAVAAATAAAADAALAAARAAVAVVRLTSQSRVCRRKWAAAKIQAAFRGHLARKAFRALKGLVRIQALVRGFLVRKQAAVTLHSMQALVRAQQSVQALRARTFVNNDQKHSPRFRSRKSLGSYEEHPVSSSDSKRLSSSFETFDDSPKIVEVDTGCGPKSRSKRPNTWISDSSANAIISTPESKNLAEQAMSVCAKSCLSGCAEYPSYVVLSRQSCKTKQRSQSAPKQRPQPGPNGRLSLLDLMQSRNSVSGVTVTQANEAINFKRAVMEKLGRSPNFVKQRD